ncbi:reductive dehalogenase [Thermodesulfobacteriota bacterium]
MKGFINPRYPLSNRNMKRDRTWGGTNPRLRPGVWYPNFLLPRVLPERPGFVGTSKVDDEIVRLDIGEAMKKIGSYTGHMYDPPEYRFLKGDWKKRVAKIVETMSSPDPHPLHRTLKKFSPTDSFAKHVASAGDGEVSPKKFDVRPVVFSRAVKQFVYDLGAEATGITRLNRDWVWLENGKETVPDIYTHVIILAVRHPHWRISHSPSFTSDLGSWVAYHHTSFMAIELADFIRSLGYHAKANSMLTGYDISFPPHEIEAGMGEQCRIGVNLHPILGPAYKVAAVLTSAPLVTDRPIEFDLESFCEKCEKCARECPPNAIPKGKKNKMKTRGVTKWQVDALSCQSYWLLHNRYNFPDAHDACASCISSCPWTKHNSEAWNHRLVVAAVSNFRWSQSFAIKMDDVFGYGKRRQPDPAWERWF